MRNQRQIKQARSLAMLALMSNRRKVKLSTHLGMIAIQLFCMIAAFLLGVIFMSVFLFTEEEFWNIVEKFWGLK